MTDGTLADSRIDRKVRPRSYHLGNLVANTTLPGGRRKAKHGDCQHKIKALSDVRKDTSQVNRSQKPGRAQSSLSCSGQYYSALDFILPLISRIKFGRGHDGTALEKSNLK
jgi:hypothetical protein